MRSFADKVNQQTGNTTKEHVAVALIGHGQPAKWDREFPTMTEQQNLFREKITELLVRDGYRKENIKMTECGSSCLCNTPYPHRWNLFHSPGWKK